ncbi:hypothetical protein LWI28_018935 [Acer negundo]|uniref:Uncharacterized protein n=1 Tax=Acer negundo TaxID=4023 RepID=A0AAD5NNL8_ACENE|nr:hypothetical protein LWI28_018935 [Acer negundo]
MELPGHTARTMYASVTRCLGFGLLVADPATSAIFGLPCPTFWSRYPSWFGVAAAVVLGLGRFYSRFHMQSIPGS